MRPVEHAVTPIRRVVAAASGQVRGRSPGWEQSQPVRSAIASRDLGDDPDERLLACRDLRHELGAAACSWVAAEQPGRRWAPIAQARAFSTDLATVAAATAG